MSLDLIFFLILSLIAVATALGMLFGRNAVYSALFLVLNFVTVAIFYLLLGAPFIAMAQVTVYAGAIMVLFLFVVMLLNAPKEDAAEWDQLHPLKQRGVARFGAMLASLLVVQLAWALFEIAEYDAPVGGQAGAATVSSVRELGRVLFTDHMFAFEATSILILVAMVGAVVLARREGEDE